MTISETQRATERGLDRATTATRVAFLIAGFAVTTWSPLVPFVKDRLALDDGALGVFLMFLGCGSLLGMPAGSVLASRYGCGRPIAVCVLFICLSLPVLSYAPSYLPSAVTLFIFGAALGCLDCVMNVHGVKVERQRGVAMMSGFHGMYSLGGIVGSLFAFILLSANVPPAFVGLIVVFLIAVIFGPVVRNFLPEAGGEAFSLRRPSWVILFSALICFALFLTDGVILNWSALLVLDDWGGDPRFAGYAYVIFAAVMTLTRLMGNRIVTALGSRNTLVFGSVVVISGLIVVTGAPTQALSAFGYGVIALGGANMVPVAFSAVGKQTAVPHSAAVSIVTICGYTGSLIGPAIIGALAHQTSLRLAILSLTILIASVGILASLQRKT